MTLLQGRTLFYVYIDWTSIHISNFTCARYYFLYAEFNDFLCQPIFLWTNYTVDFYTYITYNSVAVDFTSNICRKMYPVAVLQTAE
jgi:hypothetical protein